MYELELLDKPFRPNEVEWRIQQMGEANGQPWAMVLCYITNRAIMKRLDFVFGKLNWKNEYKQAPNGGVLCGLSVFHNGEWITKWDGSENTDIEAVKGGLSGSMKRTAVQWGVGRYLYKLPSTWVPCEAKGKNVVLKNTPKLPSWALPNGDRARQILKELGYQETQLSTQQENKGNGKPKHRNKSWKLEVVQAVIEAGIAKTPPEAVQLLNQSEIPFDTSPDDAVVWFKEHQVK